MFFPSHLTYCPSCQSFPVANGHELVSNSHMCACPVFAFGCAPKRASGRYPTLEERLSSHVRVMSPPTKAQNDFRHSSHSPAVVQDNHGAEVVIGVGHLIMTCNAVVPENFIGIQVYPHLNSLSGGLLFWSLLHREWHTIHFHCFLFRLATYADRPSKFSDTTQERLSTPQSRGHHQSRRQQTGRELFISQLFVGQQRSSTMSRRTRSVARI